MLINVGRLGRVGGLPLKINSGLTVAWAYAGGATVASPATIWSENTSDANNNITVKYNGVAAWVAKKVAGATTYVSVPITLAAGTYPVKIVLNADNTMQLIVNGTAALSGYGNTVIVNGDNEAAAATSSLQYRGTWTQSNEQAYAGTYSGKYTCNVTTAASHQVFFAGQTSGKIYSISTKLYNPASGIPSIGLYDANTGTAIGGMTAVTTTDAWADVTAEGQWTSGAFGVGNTATTNYNGKVFYLDNIISREIRNNTDTTAIPWATVL